jgi:DNA-binding NtrC family response regulator
VNCARFIASLSQGNVAGIADLPPNFHRSGSAPPSGWLPAPAQTTPMSAIRTDLPYKEAKREWLDIFEAQYVQGILRDANGNVSEAARKAGMDRRSIQRILRRQTESD